MCTTTHAHGGGDSWCPDLHRAECGCGGVNASCSMEG